MGNQLLKKVIGEQREKIAKLEAENKQLKSWFYCQCKKPDYNKFSMDNMCAICLKPIEDQVLASLSQEKKSSVANGKSIR